MFDITVLMEGDEMSHTDYYIDYATDNINLKNIDNPILLYSGISKFDNDWTSIVHKHNYLELFYIINGKGKAIIDNTEYSINPNDLIVVNPGLLHTELSNSNDQLEYIFLAIDNIKLKEMEPNSIIPQNGDIISPVISFGSSNNKFLNCFSELLSETSNKSDGYFYVCKNLVSLILLYLLRIIYARSQNQNKGINEDYEIVKTFIDANFSKQICLDDLAGKTYVSRYHFSHMFKKETGYSPIHYLTSKRIEEAKLLLLTTPNTITNISQMVGYDNPVYFSQIFKKITGISPKSYREKNFFEYPSK